MERSTSWLILPVLAVFSAAPAFGTSCTTIANGEFANASIWSCGCDPTSCDTLIIEHEVSHVGDLLLPVDRIWIGATGSLTATGKLGLYAELLCEGTINAVEIETDVPHQARCSGVMNADIIRIGNADTLFNTGQIMANDSMLFGFFSITENNGGLVADHGYAESSFYNHGSCTFHEELIAVRLFVNAGSMTGGGLFSFYGSLHNEQGSTIETDRVFLFGGSKSIHGTIITDSAFYLGNEIDGGNIQLYGDGALICHKDFYNYGYIHGGGSICIGRHSENHGMLESVDICDATPTVAEEPILDVNDGTVWNSVNYCQNGYCASLTEVKEGSAMDGIQVVPNPASGRCTIRLPAGLAILAYDLFDAHGKRVAQRSTSWRNELDLEVPPAGAGAYVLVLHGPGGTRAVRSVVFLP